MTSDKRKNLEAAFNRIMNVGFCLVPYEDISDIVAPEPMVYGTAKDERIFSFDGIQALFELQIEQIGDMAPQLNRERLVTRISADENNAVIIEEATFTLSSGDEVNSIFMRVTCVMEYMNEQWKLTHWHASSPVETENDPWHVKEWEAEKKRLQKKVDEQTADLQQKNRELEIEAATERVRSVAMGMQNPDDILDVLRVVKDEIYRFEFGNVSTWMWTIQDDNKVSHWELADHFFEGGLDALNATFDPSKAEIPQSFMDKMGSDFFSFHYKDDQILKYLDDVTKAMGPDVAEEEAGKSFKDAVESGKINNLWQLCSTFDGGLIGLMFVSEPPENVEQVLVKITDAFGMAYQRFEDLQDAEQRRKEAELEAAVERVRAHAMGMHEPKDIMNVLNVIKQELEKFELENIGTWAWIFNEDGTLTQWDISEIDLNGTMANVNVTIDLQSMAMRPHAPYWESNDYYTMPWTGSKLKVLIEEIKELDPASGEMFEDAVNEGRLSTYWQACAPFSRGVLGLDYAFEPPAEAERVLTKMSSAFDMAYRRFEDLQKVERRARESKIESALERIRSQSLAMQSSSELRKVADVLYEQMKELDQPLLEGSAIHFYEKHDDEIEAWFNMPSNASSGEHVAGRALFPKNSCWVTKEWLRNYESENGEYEVITSKEQQAEWLEVLTSHASMVGSIASIDEPRPTHMHFVDFSGGAMVVVSLDPISDDTKSLQKRAAAVFDFAYRRYEDLKLAEFQAYESRVEASLERVRGMAAAMNHSDDLKQIAEAMFREMEILKINPLRYGLGIIDKDAQEAKLWASTVNDGHYLDELGNLSLTWHPMLRLVLDAWDAQHEEMIYKLKGKELSDYYQKVGKLNPEIPDLDKLQDPDTDVVHYVSFFPFKTGTLYAFTDGEPNEDGRSILKRFANVFEQAHIRYGDLQIAEKQARQIREERDRLADTLKELRATQEQLVQQEKLASLGQLTAGIAHEIKNPLNFVNNFSDVSLELVEEARDEVRRVTEDGVTKRQKAEVKSEVKGETSNVKGAPSEASAKDGEKAKVKSEKESLRQPAESAEVPDGTEVGDDEISAKDDIPSLLLDILDDIEANLKTIHKHGSRADAIVKSMLQHSRGGDGKMEPTLLNPIIKEYVNLAFHGMRAGNDPIEVDIELQLDEGVGEVPLVAEDFSRVILNLVNNAFDALRETSNVKGETEESPFEGGRNGEAVQGDDAKPGYSPKLTVRTRSSSNTVTIEIEDNGPGIPDDMKDKILQPFFTTKKGTAGTGLGLSITNDIVKAHGGSLDIKTSPGNGATFIIALNREL